MWRANMGRNPQATQKPTQWRGKIPARHTSHPTGITIKGHLTWTPVLAQEGDHRFHGRLFMEILSGLGQQSDRGSCVNEIADFDDMLALALRALLRRDGAHILLHPSGSLPMALAVRLGGAALWNASADSPWHVGSSRSFDWSGAEGPVLPAAPGHEEGNRARHEGQAHASNSLVEPGASPQSAW